MKKGRSVKKQAKKDGSVDPFAATVEPVVASETAEKPKRAIKVIKASKVLEMAATAKVSNAPATSTNDAFAEIADTTPKAEEVKLELPAKTSKRRAAKKTAKSVTSTVAARTTKTTEKVGVVTAASTMSEIDELPDVTSAIAAVEPEVELSPVFKALADVTLPELLRENRARLQMQSPTRLYFYWSLRQNPWQQLRAVFGADLGSYTLVLKLRNLTAETEEIEPVETEGEWWFNDAEPDSEYVAEIGFYATNRPYFRVLYSNTVTTPRRSPSPHPASEARWTVSATKFAEVLDASGFTHDAVDVAIAGDDHLDAEQRTKIAFSDLMTGAEYSTRGIAAEDMRHAILALAGGATLDNLRHRVSASLFNVLQANSERLSTSGAQKALTEHFDMDENEWTEEQFGPAVFGASLVNFPKTLKSRKDAKYSPRYNPVSSFSIGR